MQQKWSVNARLDWALFWTMNLNQKMIFPAVGRKLISKSQQPENLGRRYYFLFVTMEGIRRNLEKSCLDLIDFLSASDSIDGVSVIRITSLIGQQTTEFPTDSTSTLRTGATATRTEIQSVYYCPTAARRPLIPFRGLVRRCPFTTTREEFAS